MYLQQSGGPDHLAPRLVRQLSLFGDGVFLSHLWTRGYLVLSRWNFYITGRIFPDQLGPRISKIGETAYLQVRTCWLDDCVETFVTRHLDSTTGKANVNAVILGAGYDTRCYRLNLVERGVHTFEVDTPSTQRGKLKSLKEAGIDTSSTIFVTCDFTTEDWLTRLQDNGLDETLPTLFIWEGVTMYLPRQAIKMTIEKVGKECAPGSCIGFDYLDRTWALTDEIQNIMKRWGEPWLFGMTGNEPEELIAECAEKVGCELAILDHLKHKELIRRYLAKHCDGRPIGFLDDFGGFVLVDIVPHKAS
jgi:methyltransferase (TIGR00027 family)